MAQRFFIEERRHTVDFTRRKRGVAFPIATSFLLSWAWAHLGSELVREMGRITGQEARVGIYRIAFPRCVRTKDGTGGRHL
jgi:hypothetical protein